MNIKNKKPFQNKSQNEINDEFSWSVVDDLINKKNIPLETIINYYIKICIDIIKDKSVIFKANEYIKAVINYYSYNFSNEKINSMQSKMIELFLDIDYNIFEEFQFIVHLDFLLILKYNEKNKQWEGKVFSLYIDNGKLYLPLYSSSPSSSSESELSLS